MSTNPNGALRVLVAEDEPYNLRRLARLLREQGCEVVAELEDGPAVLDWLDQGGEADALFLDIQMPGRSGLEVAGEAPRGIPVVFVTAFSEHAVRAFEQAAADYLLKPVTAERLARTLERLRERREAAPAPARSQGPFRYAVRAGEGLVFLDLARTTHFTYEEEAVWSHAGGRFRTLWKTLSEAEAALEGRGLVRGHRHLLLRPEAVVGVRPGDSGRLWVRLPGDVEVEVSRGAALGLKKRLGLA
jgi:two-component system LytT family response regulator/two-component system response regulator AlgR